MRASRLALFALPVVAGVALGFLLPRWRTLRIDFAPGGRAVSVEGGPAQVLPASLVIDDDGRLRLHVINRDTVAHQAGVLGVGARDSLLIGAELCTGQEHGKGRTIELR